MNKIRCQLKFQFILPNVFHAKRFYSKSNPFSMQTFLRDFNADNELESVYNPASNQQEDKINIKMHSLNSLSKYKLNKFLESSIQKKELSQIENILQEVSFQSLNASVLTYLVNFYVDIGEIDKAMRLFQNMKDCGKLKHDRMYGKLIIALCHDNKVQQAFHLFQEFTELEFFSKTARIKPPDDKISIALLQGVELLNIKGKTRKESSTKDISSSSDMEEVSKDSPQAMLYFVMKYISHWNLALSNPLLNAFYNLFKTWNINISQARVCNSDCKCTSCGTLLSSEQNDFKRFVRDYIERLEQVLEQQGFGKDLFTLNKHFRNSSYFDVIIDGGNLLYKGVKNTKVFTPWRLQNCLTDIYKQQESFCRVALILPQTFHRSTKMKELDFLHELALQNVYNMSISIIACKSLHDDNVFLYTAAKSEMNNPKVVKMISNDQFLNHAHVLNADLKGDWMNWCLTRRLVTDSKGYPILKKHLLPIQKSNSKMHFVSKDFNVLCVDSSSFENKIYL